MSKRKITVKLSADNDQLMEFLDNQSLLSMSIEAVINDYIATYGTQDVVSTKLGVSVGLKRGRPVKPANEDTLTVVEPASTPSVSTDSAQARILAIQGLLNN